MPTQRKLRLKHSTELAVLCQQVADDPERYTEAAASEAFKLKLEWVRLQTPPLPSLKAQQEVERKRAEVRKRMIKFLAGVLV
jgi:hypothetical protein